MVLGSSFLSSFGVSEQLANFYVNVLNAEAFCLGAHSWSALQFSTLTDSNAVD